MSMDYDWTTVAGSSGLGTVTIDASTMASITLGSAGQVLTTGVNGASYTWADTISASNDLFPDTLDCKGDASFSGDIKIKGVSLSDTLERLEERLAILRPNAALEDRWDQLKELGKQYRELEKEILEKEQVWKILKK